MFQKCYLTLKRLCLHLQVKDLHRHKIDHITIPSKKNGVLRRVEDVSPGTWYL